MGGFSIASFSLFKWVKINEPLKPINLLEKKALLAELVDLIIPETDTPGAQAAMVHEYIIAVVINCYPIKQQRLFFSGLQNIEEYALQKYDTTFLNCGHKQKTEILIHFSTHSGYSNKILDKINNRLFGEPFYSTLHKLTVEGYCVSFLGATKGMAYDYIPGKYNACVPLLTNQKNWATK